MNISSPIGRLEDVDIRQAWKHEALDFTPWLYSNLNELGNAVGMQLEGEGMEVAVESFSADILARNAMDDSIVLIENQLACSDHSHLGQIMTYLAGLEAQAVIWVATQFREPHLSAINWLNEHTDESFAFFAVQVRTVRIGNSPYAPLFDVLARPNNWERHLHAIKNSRDYSELTNQRYSFWEAFVARVPNELERYGEPQRVGNRWRELTDLELIISMYIASNKVGIFIRGTRGADGESIRDRLAPYQSELEQRLGVAIGESADHFFVCQSPGDYTDPNQVSQLIDWLSEKADLYENVLLEILSEVD